AARRQVELPLVVVGGFRRHLLVVAAFLRNDREAQALAGDGDARDSDLDPGPLIPLGQNADEQRRLSGGVLSLGFRLEREGGRFRLTRPPDEGTQGLDLYFLDTALVLAQGVQAEHAALLVDDLGMVVVRADLHDEAAVCRRLVAVSLPRGR